MKIKDILIVSALKEETQNKLDDYDMLYTGVGKVNATYHLTSYLSKSLGWYSDKPQLIINFGTAGSRDIPLHTLVKCTKFVQRDMDKTALGFKKGETAFEDDIPMVLDFGEGYVCGTGDNFVQDINKEIDCDVFDMEAYALAKTCWKNKINFVSYKYITDNANEKSADDWLENCGKGVKEFKKILEHYL